MGCPRWAGVSMRFVGVALRATVADACVSRSGCTAESIGRPLIELWQAAHMPSKKLGLKAWCEYSPG